MLIASLRLFLGCALFFGLSAGSGGAAQNGNRTVTAHDIATLTDIEALSVSPDARWAAFQTRRPIPQANAYELTWWVVPTSGGPPRRIADGGRPVQFTYAWPRMVVGFIEARTPVWSPDSQWIVYVKRDDRGAQLWRSHIDGRNTEQLTRNEADVTEVGLALNKQQLFFKTLGSQAQLAAALEVEGRSGFRFDDRFSPSISAHPLAPLGAGLRGTRGVEATGGAPAEALWIYDFAGRREYRADEAQTREYTKLSAAPAVPDSANVRGAVAASEGGSIAWTEARDPALQGMTPPLTVVARPKGATAPIVCDAPVCRGQFVGILRWIDDDALLFRTIPRENGMSLHESLLYRWRPGKDADPVPILRTSARYHISYQPNCATVRDRMVCLYEELNRPRRLVAIDLNHGAVETLFDPNPQWTRFDLGAPPQAIPVKLASGPQFHSYLALPPDYRPGRRLPLVMVTYVCQGFLRGGTGDEYPVYAFAAQGFAVLCHNHVLHDRALEASSTDAMPPEMAPGDGDAYRKRIQDGVDAAIDELDRRGVIDTQRVGITGMSAGAQLVEYSMIHMPRLTTAIESGTMFETVLVPLADRIGREVMRRAGFDSPFSPRWQTRAVSRNARSIRAPLLINTSDQEILGGVELLRALQDAGRAVEMYVFPNEHHFKTQPAHRLAVYHRNIDWMNFWLRGVETGLTGEKGQYERWSVLRDQHCRALTATDPPWFCVRTRKP